MEILFYKTMYIFLWIVVFLGVSSPEEMNKIKKKIDSVDKHGNDI